MVNYLLSKKNITISSILTASLIGATIAYNIEPPKTKHIEEYLKPQIISYKSSQINLVEVLNNMEKPKISNEKPKKEEYIIVSGDSLGKIALRYNNLSWQKIYEENKDRLPKGPDFLKIGTKIYLPIGSKHKKSLEEKLGLDSNHKNNLDFIKSLDGNKIDEITLALGNGSRKLGSSKLAELLGVRAGICQGFGNSAYSRLNEYQQIILENSKDKNTAKTIGAIIIQESGADPNCISTTNSLGIMGLSRWLFTQKTHSDNKVWSSINPFDPNSSILRGIKFYNHLVEKYDKPAIALLAYNQGEGVVNSVRRILKSANIENSYSNIVNLKTIREQRTRDELVSNLENSKTKREILVSKYNLKIYDSQTKKVKTKLELFSKKLEEAKSNNDFEAINLFSKKVNQLENFLKKGFSNNRYLDDGNGNFYISKEGRNYANQVAKKELEIEKFNIFK